MDKNCVVCNRPFAAKRVTAKFCSAACRVKFNRQVTDDPTPMTPVAVIESSDWFNSAELKTQAEIEGHYTLENYPPIKYYSSGGGGTGSLTPPVTRR